MVMLWFCAIMGHTIHACTQRQQLPHTYVEPAEHASLLLGPLHHLRWALGGHVSNVRCTPRGTSRGIALGCMPFLDSLRAGRSSVDVS